MCDLNERDAGLGVVPFAANVARQEATASPSIVERSMSSCSSFGDSCTRPLTMHTIVLTMCDIGCTSPRKLSGVCDLSARKLQLPCQHVGDGNDRVLPPRIPILVSLEKRRSSSSRCAVCALRCEGAGNWVPMSTPRRSDVEGQCREIHAAQPAMRAFQGLVINPSTAIDWY